MTINEEIIVSRYSPIPITICYVGGCGRLGYPMSAWAAYRGFKTIIADINEEAVKAVQAGTFQSPEPMTNEIVLAASDNLTATTNTREACTKADIIFILVQTPSLASGAFSLEYVFAACDEIGLALKESPQYKVVAVVSTVMPGHIEVVKKRLERISGKVAHQDFGLCYCPEFIRQGSIIKDFSEARYVVIGHEEERAADVMTDYYQAVTLNEPQIHRMSTASAEIAKLGLNTAIVAKVARANEIAWLCHLTPGADAADVLGMIGSDPRVGSKYFGAGLPPGGPCFPRDNRAIIVSLRERGVFPHLAWGVVDFNDHHLIFLAKLIQQAAGSEKTVGFLGLTYKPGTDLLVGSLTLVVAARLYNVPVLAFDPMARSPDENVISVGSLEELVERSDVLVLMTCWPEFKAVAKMDLSGKTVVDMWGFFDKDRLNCAKYIRFGKGPG